MSRPHEKAVCGKLRAPSRCYYGEGRILGEESGACLQGALRRMGSGTVAWSGVQRGEGLGPKGWRYNRKAGNSPVGLRLAHGAGVAKMTAITSCRSKGPLGAGAMRGTTASTQRLEVRDDAPHRGRRAQTDRCPGFGPGGTGKVAAEDLLFQPDRGNPAVRDEGGARRDRGQAP